MKKRKLFILSSVLGISFCCIQTDVLAQDPPTIVERVPGLGPVLARKPVRLRDTGMFNVSVHIVRRSELHMAQRRLAAAIAAEQWTDGLLSCFQIIRLLGGISP